MLDPKSVADSICKIETELCYLHGLLAAEELGVAALQPTNSTKAKITPWRCTNYGCHLQSRNKCRVKKFCQKRSA